jgi:hypothetical protein
VIFAFHDREVPMVKTEEILEKLKKYPEALVNFHTFIYTQLQFCFCLLLLFCCIIFAAINLLFYAYKQGVFYGN